MLMMTPSGDEGLLGGGVPGAQRSAGNAARLKLKVPTASMSSTVRKPLADSSVNGVQHGVCKRRASGARAEPRDG
jgi:hypothetical protein